MTTYTMADIFLGRTKTVRVLRYIRAKGCLMLTRRHAWGNGSFWSWYLAWRTNPSGTQPCGCTYEYGVVQ